MLAVHHRKMFDEIRRISGTPVDPAVLVALEDEYAGKLEGALGTGATVAWVVDA